MSIPEPLECLDPPCLVALACQFAGSCRARRIDSARSYDEAIRAMREALEAAVGIKDPFRKGRG